MINQVKNLRMLSNNSTGMTSDQVSTETVKAVPLSTLSTERESVQVGDSGLEETTTSSTSLVVNPLEEFICRNILIASGTLTSSDVLLLDQLTQPFDPWKLWGANATIIDKLKGYYRLRGELEVEITVTPPSNAYGAYCFNATCEGVRRSTTANVTWKDTVANDTPWTATQDLHGIIDVSLGTTVTLKLAFVHPYDAFQLPFATDANIQNNPMWRVSLWAYDPIKNATNAEAISCTYKITARLLPGYELGTAMYQAKKKKGGAVTSSKGAANPHPEGTDSWYAHEFGGDGGPEPAKKSGGGKLSGIANTISSVATSIGSAIPALAPFAGPIAVGANIAGRVASMFGFTRETNLTPAELTQVRMFSPLSQIDCTDHSEVVSMMKGNVTTIDPRIGGGIEGDPCTFSDLFARWTLIDRVGWATSDVPGTLLKEYPITPGLSANTLGVVYMTPAGFVGMPFRAWRGTMEYMIYVPTSVYHRGMLQVAWSPIYGVTTSGDITHKLQNVIFDVTVEHSKHISIDYAQIEPTKIMRIVPMTGYLGVANDQLNGGLKIFVHSKLQCMTETADTNILVFARASANMRFGCPLNTYQFGTNVGNSTGWHFQAGGVGDNLALQGDVTPLVQTNDAACPLSTYLWGEDIASVRGLMQKFSPILQPGGNLNDETDAEFGNGYAIPHFWPLSDDPDIINQYYLTNLNRFNWYAWYASLFVGVRGSTRYKVTGQQFSNAENNMPVCHAVPLRTDDLFFFDSGTTGAVTNGSFFGVARGGNPRSINSHFATQDGSTNGGVEYLLPYYGTRKYESPHVIILIGSGADADNLAGSMDYRWDGLAFASYDIAFNVIYQAGGPDIAPIRFRRVPGMIFDANDPKYWYNYTVVPGSRRLVAGDEEEQEIALTKLKKKEWDEEVESDIRASLKLAKEVRTLKRSNANKVL